MEGSSTHPDASSSEPRAVLAAAATAAAAAAPPAEPVGPNGRPEASSLSPRILNGLDFPEDTVLVAKKIMVIDDDDEEEEEEGEDVAAPSLGVATPPGPDDRHGTRATGVRDTGHRAPVPQSRTAQAGGSRSSEARFEIKACKEERKPSKLFSDDGDSEGGYRLQRKDQRDDEKKGLEMERQALIRSQAKRSFAGSPAGGVASVARAWNPPQEASLEEKLHEAQLESLRRYQERKQKQQQRWGGHVPSGEQRPKMAEGSEAEAAPHRKKVTKSVSQPAISSAAGATVPRQQRQQPPRARNENVEVSPVDFAMARRQFLMMERASHLQSALPYPVRRRASVDQPRTPQSLGSVPPSPCAASPQSPRSVSQSPVFPAQPAQRPQVSPSFIFSHASLPPSYAPAFPPAQAPATARPAAPSPPAIVAIHAAHAVLPSPQSPGFASLATGFLPTPFPGFALPQAPKSVAEAAVQTDAEEPAAAEEERRAAPAAEAAGDERENPPAEGAEAEAESERGASGDSASGKLKEREASGNGGEGSVEPVEAFVGAIEEEGAKFADVAENVSLTGVRQCRAEIDAAHSPEAAAVGDVEIDDAVQAQELAVSAGSPQLEVLPKESDEVIVTESVAATCDEPPHTIAEPTVSIGEAGALRASSGIGEHAEVETTGAVATAATTEAAQRPGEADDLKLPLQRSEPRAEAIASSHEQDRAEEATSKSNGVNVGDKPTEPPEAGAGPPERQESKEQLTESVRQENDPAGVAWVEELTADAASIADAADVEERPEDAACLPDPCANVESSLETELRSLAALRERDNAGDGAQVCDEAASEDRLVEQEAAVVETVDGDGDAPMAAVTNGESDHPPGHRGRDAAMGGSTVTFVDLPLEEDDDGSERAVGAGRENMEAVAAEMVRAMVAKAVEMINSASDAEDAGDGSIASAAAADGEWEPTTDDYTVTSDVSESVLAAAASPDASASCGIADGDYAVVLGATGAVGPKGEARVLREALVFTTGELDSGVESVATKTPDGDNNTLGLTSTELSLVSDFCDTADETPSVSANVTPDVEKVPMLFISVSDENDQIIEQEMIVSALLDEQLKHVKGRKDPPVATVETAARTEAVSANVSPAGVRNVHGSDESLDEEFGMDELQIEDVVKDLQDTVAFEEGKQADIEKSLAQEGKQVYVEAPFVEERERADHEVPLVEECKQVNVEMASVEDCKRVDRETPSIKERKQVNDETPLVEEHKQVDHETPLVEEHKQVGHETPLVEEHKQVGHETPLVEEHKQVNDETPLVEEHKQVDHETPLVEEHKQVDPETPLVGEYKLVDHETPLVGEHKQVDHGTPLVGEHKQVDPETPLVEEHKQVDPETPLVEEHKQVDHETPLVEEHKQVDPETPLVGEHKQVDPETPLVREHKQVDHETPLVEEHKQVDHETPLVEEHKQVDHETPSVEEHNQVDHETPLVEEHNQVDHATPLVEEHKQVDPETPLVGEHKQVDHETPLVEEHKQVDHETPSVEEHKQVDHETPLVEEHKQVDHATPLAGEHKQVDCKTPLVEEHNQVGHETPLVVEHKQVDHATPLVEEHKQVDHETPSVEEHKQVGHETPLVEEHKQVDHETPSVEEHKQVDLETPLLGEHKQDDHETPLLGERKQFVREKRSTASNVESDRSDDNIAVPSRENDPVASSSEPRVVKPCADAKESDSEEKSTNRDNEINLQKERVEMCRAIVSSAPDLAHEPDDAAAPTLDQSPASATCAGGGAEISADRDDETDLEDERAELPGDDEDDEGGAARAPWQRDGDATMAARGQVTPPTPPPSEASITETAVQTDAEDFPEELEGFEASPGPADSYGGGADAWHGAAEGMAGAEPRPANSLPAEEMTGLATPAELVEKLAVEVAGEEAALRQSAADDATSSEDTSAEPSENGHAAAEDDEVGAAGRNGEERGPGGAGGDKEGDGAAVAHPAPHSTGPCFRLRPRKQNTLSMIEQEIRESQEREEELRAQRRSLYSSDDSAGHASPSPPPAASSAVAVAAPPAESAAKLMAEASQQQHKTGPGRIERAKPAAAALAPEEAEEPPVPRGLMQSLVKDYDKVKLREKKDDPLYARIQAVDEVASEVVEVTRVTRRKSAKAMRWEAGIYTNHAEEGN